MKVIENIWKYVRDHAGLWFFNALTDILLFIKNMTREVIDIVSGRAES